MANILNKIRTKHKHGLLRHTISHKIGQKGVRVYPYYLIQEGTDEVDLPEFKGDIKEYSFGFLDPEDLETIEENAELKGKKAEFQNRLDKGQICLCVNHQGQIVAYTWFDFEACRFIDPLFKLKDNEAYLFDMYTLQSHRGKNIAPYLRFKGYEALHEMGKDTLYSISEYFNTPAIKFKKKLNTKFLGLYVLFDIFRKWRWIPKIKGYKN